MQIWCWDQVLDFYWQFKKDVKPDEQLHSGSKCTSPERFVRLNKTFVHGAECLNLEHESGEHLLLQGGRGGGMVKKSIQGEES